jgi:2'-hydroxyisoflavone reductase
MRLLVLGGTSFVGRHIVDSALAGGHDVTLFNRGKTNPGLFPECESLVGDRVAGDYASLAGGSWDALIDVNAYFVRQVREAAAAVGGRVGHYTFISTGSVYDNPGDGPVDEDHERATVDDPAGEDVSHRNYGGLKALCEDEVRTLFGARSTIVRPGIVAGPHDPTERFTYWVRRMARAARDGGSVAAPARPDQPVQIVHARDLADLVVGATAAAAPGPFNGVGPDSPVTLASVLAACAAASGVEADIAWIDEAVLADRKVGLPLWLPSGMGIDGLFRCTNDRARAAVGFSNRPVEETAADTLAWDRGRDGFPGDLAGTPSAADEAALLAAAR